MEKSEANDSIFHTTGLEKLPHTILTIAADDRRGRSDSVLDSDDKDPKVELVLIGEGGDFSVEMILSGPLLWTPESNTPLLLLLGP